MDTICEKQDVSTKLELFGKKFSAPFFAGPVGSVKLHYGEKYTEDEYNQILVSGCAKEGIAAFTGDGVDEMVMKEGTAVIAQNDG